MPDDDEKRFSRAEMEAFVEARVAKRLSEIETSETIRKLEEGFERLEKKVDATNHLRDEFAREVRAINKLLRAHIAEPSHHGTEEKLMEVDARLDTIDTMHAAQAAAFGIDQLSADEKAAAAEVLREAAERRRHQPVIERHSRSRREIVGLLLTAVMTAVAVIAAVINWLRADVIVHGTP